MEFQARKLGSPRNYRLNTATASARAVVKKKEALVVTDATASAYLLPEVVSALEALLQTMKTVFCIYRNKFQKLHGIYELQDGKDLGEIVDLLLCDDPHDVRHKQYLQNSEHAVFNGKYMDTFCDFGKFVLNC